MIIDTGDRSTIERIVREVPGVREAAVLIDHRLKADSVKGPAAADAAAAADGADAAADADADADADAQIKPGRPISSDVPAIVHGPKLVLPADAVSTLPEALLAAAARARDRGTTDDRGIADDRGANYCRGAASDRGTTYVRSDVTTDRQTYAELLYEALCLLGGLRGAGVRPGDAVLVHHADNRNFVTTWWACVLGGFLPTAVGTARDYTGDNATVRKLHAAWALLEHPLIVTDDDLREQVAGLADRWSDDDALRVASPASLAALTDGNPVEPYPAHPDDSALNLLTSGSTGTPKCVHHTHRSIIARTYAAIDANEFTADEVSLNWMPLDHVGGMVMFNLRDVVLGCEHINVPTELVIRRPLTWLDLIDRFRVTNTWAPNFAFSLVNKCAAEIEVGHWDLSSLSNICNAGEAVVPRTARRFLELLTPHGLPPDAMIPCWGMSETSSGVTYSRMDARDSSAGIISLDPASLESTLVELPASSVRAMTVCEVGAPVAGVSLRIVDDEGSILPEGRVGRLHVSGTTILREYLHNDAANAASFTADGWFDTGDLGFLRNGRLFLTGRKKHMVIVNGVNYPAHEVEAVVEQVSGVRPACTAVCAIRDEEDDTDGIVVFFVPTDEAVGELDRVLADICAALATDLALRAKWLIPVNELEFPRAAGGKVQRERLIEALRAGRFGDRMYPGEALAEDSDEDTLLEVVWVPVDVSADTPRRAGRTLLYSPAGWRHTPDAEMAVITSGATFNVLGERHVEADLTDPGQQDRALSHLLGVLGHPDHVVYATEADADAADDAGPAARFMVSVAAIAKAVPDADVTVLVSNSLAVRPQDKAQPARATLPALIRTAAAEGHFRNICLVDVSDAAESAAQLAAQLTARPEEIPRYDGDLIAIRDDAAYTPKLRRLEQIDRFDIPDRFLPPDGTVLITGGLGGIGRVIAEHLLVASGARLLIVGRTSEAELSESGRDKVLAHLRTLGEVRYAPVDVSDANALASAVANAEQTWGRALDLVLHLAGASVASQWGRLSAHTMDAEQLSWLRDMLRPKLGGATALDRLLQTRPNTSIVLFSSVIAFLGSTGFGAYAAANASLHAFAHEWMSRGHDVRCLDWSMWNGPGMNEGNPLVPAARHRGLRLIDPGKGLSLFLAALHHPAPIVLAGVDARNPHVTPHLAAEEFEGGGVIVALVPDAGLEPERIRHDVGAALAAHGVFARVIALRELPVDATGEVDRVAVLAAGSSRLTEYRPPVGPTEELVARIVGELLNLGEVSRQDSVFGLGCDSIRAVQLVERVGAQLGYEVPVGLLYENPTVRELAAAVTAPVPMPAA